MKKPIQVPMFLIFGLTLFLVVAFYQMSLQRTKQAYQLESGELKKKVVLLEKQISDNKQKEDAIKDWKNYEDEELGIRFKYPMEWFKLENKNKHSQTFLKKPQVAIFGIILFSDTVEKLPEEIAKNKIAENNCPADRIVNVDNSSILYVTECGAMSEIYNYIFKNKKGETIQLSYHDDFDSNWSDDKKLEKFKLIIDTISLF